MSASPKSIFNPTKTREPSSRGHDTREEMCSHTINVLAPHSSSNVSITQIRPCSMPLPSDAVNSTTIPQNSPTHHTTAYPYLWVLGPGIFVLLLILYGLRNFRRDMRIYMHAQRKCNGLYREQYVLQYVLDDLEGQPTPKLPTINEEGEDTGSSSTVFSWAQIFTTSSLPILPGDIQPPGAWPSWQPPHVESVNNSPEPHDGRT